MHSFSIALQMEVKKYNITVQNVAPFLVRSKLSPELKNTNCLVLPSGDVGFEAMRVVGVMTTTNGHWKHKLVCSCLSLLSFLLGRSLVSRLANSIRFLFLVAIKDVTDLDNSENKSLNTQSYKSNLEKSSNSSANTKSSSNSEVDKSSATPILLQKETPDKRKIELQNVITNVINPTKPSVDNQNDIKPPSKSVSMPKESIKQKSTEQPVKLDGKNNEMRTISNSKLTSIPAKDTMQAKSKTE